MADMNGRIPAQEALMCNRGPIGNTGINATDISGFKLRSDGGVVTFGYAKVGDTPAASALYTEKNAAGETVKDFTGEKAVENIAPYAVKCGISLKP